jgi:hypothetical protein
MKKMAGKKDYVCIAGKPTDITSNLNRISSMYDLTVLSTDVRDGLITVIIERRQKEEPETGR